MKTLKVELGHRGYPIHIEGNLIDSVGNLCKERKIGTQVALITDSNVRELYLERVRNSLASCGFNVHPVVIQPGEQSKSLKEVEKILDELLSLRFERSAGVIALGGGVVGDLAGFVAATLLRGVQYVQIPTSLIAQTDSSIGGKVGINHRLGKNLIGSFYQPRLVVIDPLVLRTLEPREWIAGMGEVFKYGMIWDAELFRTFEERFDEILTLGDMQIIEDIVLRCCEIKAEVVIKDEKESNIRRILNFGHTFGHAFEAATGYERFLHGEGVLLGMIAAGWLAEKVEAFPEGEFKRLETLIRRLTFQSNLSDIDDQTILENMSRDKKVRQGKIHFVLVKRIGETVIRSDIRSEDVLDACHYVRNLFVN